MGVDKFHETRRLLESGELLTTPLWALLLDRYGTEALEWLPETLISLLAEEFQTPLRPLTVDRVGVGGLLLTTDLFYRSLPEFVVFCNVLSGSPHDPRMWDPAEPVEIAWGITESLLLDPPEEPQPFSDEIRGYIGIALDAEGVSTPPEVLQIALRPNAAASAEDFADDPDLFSSIYRLNLSRTDEIRLALREQLRRMAQQLEVLDLRTGNAEEVVERLYAGLPESERTPSIPDDERA